MRIGIDLGGTKTEIICLHDENGKELYRKRVPSPQVYHETIGNIARLVHEAEMEMSQKGTVGVGIPGTVSSVTGKVKNANSVWLNGNRLDKDLEEVLGRKVRVENDANCLAVSEATDGAGAGKKVVFAVIVGTGCGAGIAIDGRPVTGINGIAGEWGHNTLPIPKVYAATPEELLSPFAGKGIGEGTISDTYKHKEAPIYFTADLNLSEYPGPQCYCGKRGCIERWISGPGFKEDYIRVTGKELSTHDIVAQAGKGDKDALAALDRYYDRFARAISGVMNILDPDIVVVGGGMSNVAALYDEVPRLWNRYVFSDTVETPIVQARFGDSSGVRGAAWLWNKE
jgi:fructokinase